MEEEEENWYVNASIVFRGCKFHFALNNDNKVFEFELELTGSLNYLNTVLLSLNNLELIGSQAFFK